MVSKAIVNNIIWLFLKFSTPNTIILTRFTLSVIICYHSFDYMGVLRGI